MNEHCFLLAPASRPYLSVLRRDSEEITQNVLRIFIFVLFLKQLFIYLFIFGCVGSPFLCQGFL